MKLLLCEDCWDVFKLDHEMRYCKCERVFGRYVDNTYAEVSPTAVSLALGNGSVMVAIQNMREHQAATDDKATRESYHVEGQGLIIYAWARPNTGAGNPHTRLIDGTAQEAA